MPATKAANRRRKPKQGRSKETVEIILEATAQVLVRDGYHKASTNRIAQVAGVSVGSVYQYFGSKDALITALAERHSREMMAVLSEGLREYLDAPLDEVARAIVRSMVQAHAVDPELHRVLTEQVPRGREIEHLGAEIEAARKLLLAFLMHRRADLRVTDFDVAAFVLVHAVEGLTHAAVLERPDLLEDGRIEDAMVDLVLRYAKE